MWSASFVFLSFYFPRLVFPQTTLMSHFDSSPKVPLTTLVPSHNAFHMYLIHPCKLSDLPGQWGVLQNFPHGLIRCVPPPDNGIDDLVSAQDMASLITYLIKLLRFTYFPVVPLCVWGVICYEYEYNMNLTWQWHSCRGLDHFHRSLDNTV